MFGTIFTMRPKPGKEGQVLEEFDRWTAERGPKVKGAVASIVYRSVSDPGELMGAVVFDSKENYVANANDPEQDKWYRRIVDLLQGEPRWMDGDIVRSWIRK